MLKNQLPNCTNNMGFSKWSKEIKQDLLKILEWKTSFQLNRYQTKLINLIENWNLWLVDEFLNNIILETDKTFPEYDYLADSYTYWNIYKLFIIIKRWFFTTKLINFLIDLSESIIYNHNNPNNLKYKYKIKTYFRDPESIDQHIKYLQKIINNSKSIYN